MTLSSSPFALEPLFWRERDNAAARAAVHLHLDADQGVDQQAEPYR
jgi:hypothetical protein